jgi:type I restriction enzyme S subunit
MDYSKLSHEELIKICEEMNLDYMTKQKKPKAIKTLISLITKNKPNEPIIKTTYEDNYLSLEAIIDKCHNFLYTKGITGAKAQNDIMKFFTIKIINHLVINNNPYILSLIDDFKKTNDVLKDFYERYDGIIENADEDEKEVIQNYLNYIEYLKDISLITTLFNKKGDLNDEWKDFIQDCVSKIFPDIYSNEDYILNCKAKFIIRDLITIISKFNINSSVIDEVQAFNGDIHEKFLKYQGNKNSKELGQFFTPRGIVKSILNECGFKDLIEGSEGDNLSIYDPCLGTGGLLCYTYNHCQSKIKPENIYGCEIENDTMKLGIVSLMISTNNCNKNIKRCNSLIENPYLFEGKKFDIIFTNPPFGTKSNYKQLEEGFDDYKKNYYPESALEFKDIYKIQANSGIQLFIQNVIYLLNEGGVACIILPDGELMTGKSCLNIRKFILDNCQILKIITINSGAFANTGIKTKALIIKKIKNDNYNQEIEYIDITETGINNLGFEKLNDKYVFNITIIEEEIQYSDDIEAIKFGEMFKLIKGTIQSSKVIEDENGDGVFINLSKNMNYKKIQNFELDNENIFISNVSPLGLIQYYNGKSIHSNLLYHIKPNELYKEKINIKYIYYYLKEKQEYIEEKFQKGCANKSLDVEKFNELKIPIPSIEKQKEIVELLDSINDNINDTKNKIEKLKRINELYLKNSLNFSKPEIKTLGEVCEFIKTGKNKPNDNKTGTLYPYYGTGSITGYTDEYLYDGNYILTARNGSIGNCFLTEGKFFPSDHIFIIHIKDKKLMKYIYYILLNNENLDKLKTGIGIPNITKTILENLKIPIPSLEKQKEIVEYLDYNNEIINNLEKEFEFNKKKAEEFFKQIL